MRIKSLLAVLLVLMSLLFSASITRVSIAEESTCYDAVIIFARGSGQALNAPEEVSLKKELLERLPSNNYKITYLSLEESSLGTNSNYPAVGVGIGSLGDINNSVSAELSWSRYINGGKYSDSVKSGVQTLTEYFDILNNSGELARCPNTRYVLAGYSQGAEVIGDSLDYLTLPHLQPKISYVALFGDPKYKSKNKFNPFNAEPTYFWYRGNIAEKTTFNGGINDPRIPYIPSAFDGRAGSWCRDKDPICNGNGVGLLTDDIDAHGSYPDSSIDEAADEIASTLLRDFAGVGLPETPLACGAARQDIVLAMDMSDSMRSLQGPYHGENPKKFAEKLFSSACDVRVGVVGYANPIDPSPHTYLDFTSSKESFIQTLENLALTTPEESYSVQLDPINPTDARSAMLSALDEQWRKNAQKALIVVTNTSGTGYPIEPNQYVAADRFIADEATQSVIRKSREKDGVEIYYAAVPYPSYMNVRINNPSINPFEYFIPFNEATGGTMLPVQCGNYCSWNNVQMVNFGNKPKLKINSITAQVGQPIKINPIDISGNVILAATKQHDIQYNWYLDCENASAKSSWSKTFDYTFSKPQECTGAVITKAFGRYCYFCGGAFGRSLYDTSVATFNLTVLPADFTPPTTPTAPAKIENLQKSLENGALTFTWDPPSNAEEVGDIAYIIRDQDGSLIGVMTATKLIIKDLPDNNDVDITISATSSNAGGQITDTSTVPTTFITPEEVAMVSKPPVDTHDSNNNQTNEPGNSAPFSSSATLGDAPRFAYPLNNGAYLSVGAIPQPFSVSDVKGSALSIPKITTQSAVTQPQTNSVTTQMPAWLLGGLALILTGLGIKIASATFLAVKK